MINEFLSNLMIVVILLVSSIYIRVLLQIFGQSWVKTISQTATIVVLPIVTFIITKLISGNIALSLGMVGALSIVRFRNPVRSPLELVAYFGSITLGIAAAVDIMSIFLLLVAATMAALVLWVLHRGSTRFGVTPFFSVSFTDGVSQSTLMIECDEQIKLLEDHPALISKETDNSKVVYRLTSWDFEQLKNLESSIPNTSNITQIQLLK